MRQAIRHGASGSALSLPGAKGGNAAMGRA